MRDVVDDAWAIIDEEAKKAPRVLRSGDLTLARLMERHPDRFLSEHTARAFMNQQVKLGHFMIVKCRNPVGGARINAYVPTGKAKTARRRA